MPITLYLISDFSQLSDSVALQSSIWQDIFGVSSETAFQTIIPALIAILIFFLGLVFRWLGNWFKNKKENKQKRKFIFSQVEVLLTAVSNQRKSVDKFIEILKTDKIQNLEFELKVSFNPKHVNQIGSNELFRILVLSFFTNKEKRLENYNSFIKQLDLIEGLRHQFETSFNYILTHSSLYQKKWNDNIKVIRELHDKWKSELLVAGEDDKSDNFLYNFNQFYLRHITTKDFKDMYVAVPNFIEPTLQSARINSIKPYAQIILNPLLECKDAINNHRSLRLTKITEFECYIIQLNEIEDKLKDFLKLYNYSISDQTKDTTSNGDENEN